SVCNFVFANGALGHISGSNTAIKDRWISDWRIVCENLVYDSTSDGDWRTADEARFSFTGQEDILSMTRDTDLHKACMDDWLAAIKNDGQCLSPIEDAVKTHQLVFAAAESMRQNGLPMDMQVEQFTRV
ncbi:MAG: hypothetical protein HRU15_11710, partial [Planctomycetes bacterium]|nr:hypothetical protein [Planctomycetota bacterium]